jgi:hypothetical protein
MNKTFTFDHLLLLAYNETSKTETEEICQFLSEDEEMLEEYLTLQSTKDNLDQLFYDPSDDIISGLINYSNALEVFRVKPDVETVMIIKN